MTQVHDRQVEYFDSINFRLYDHIFIGYPDGTRLAIWEGTFADPHRAGHDEHLVLQVQFPFGKGDVVLLQKRLRTFVKPDGVFVNVPECFQG